MKAKVPATVEELVQTTDSPFSSNIIMKKLLWKFKMPVIESFSGATDPLDHLEDYKALMQLQSVSNEIMCRAFPITLKGNSRTWYTKLQPGSICNFKELTENFVSYFIAGQRYTKPTTYLLNIKQGEWETLREYTARFNKEA